MISEGSFDTGDWSNDTEKYIKIEKSHLKLSKIFHNITVLLCIFDKLNPVLVSIKDINIKKNHSHLKLLN